MKPQFQYEEIPMIGYGDNGRNPFAGQTHGCTLAQMHGWMLTISIVRGLKAETIKVN